MVTSQTVYLGFLGLLALERFGELALSRKNAEWAFARGGREVGQRHYRVMAALHSLFFVACAFEVVGLNRAFPGTLGWICLALAIGAQALRYWAILTLGPRWNVRIIFLEGKEPVTSGPYRWIRHPNYVAVVLELAVVPLIHGAYFTALLFSCANACLLAVRIRAEEKALGESYARSFAPKPRFVPTLRR
jgi:methyltransferase